MMADIFNFTPPLPPLLIPTTPPHHHYHITVLLILLINIHTNICSGTNTPLNVYSPVYGPVLTGQIAR